MFSQLRWRSVQVLARARARQGWSRVRTAAVPVATASAAAAIAYLIGRHVLGHPNPFFAAFAAWACLGFSFDRDLRRVFEIAIGVTMGVTFGDIVVRVIGSGWWQIALVLFAAALVARFVDRGQVLAAQAGAQAIVITGVPNLAGGPYGRALDAIVGGIVAFIIALLIPGNPLRSLRTLLATATGSLAESVELLASATGAANRQGAEAALLRARAGEPAIQEVVDQATFANRQAQLTLNRRYADELEIAQRRATLLDQSMRTVRVLARRAMYDLDRLAAADRCRISTLLTQYAQGIRQLSTAWTGGQDPAAARSILTAVANELDPTTVADDPGAQTQLMVLRSAVVDTLEAAGATPDDARAPLPDY